MMQPTRVRIAVAGLLTLMACLLYLDRYAVGIASESIRKDLGMTQTQMSWFLSAFFWSYALSQVPAGWLSDRFGPRAMLTVYILGWSLFTGLPGMTSQVSLVLLLRFLCGAAQAGAYPVCTGMIRSWFPISRRGITNSIVAMGGRSGAVLASLLTADLMISLSGGWRSVLVLYGAVGVLVAIVFAWICRDKPGDHPWCNEAERRLISGSPPNVIAACVSNSLPVSNTLATTPTPPIAVDHGFPLIPILTSISLWGNSLTQFFTNIGWLFVVTWLPRYLGDVHKVPLKEQAVMTAIPTIAGIIGMLCGGWWTDAAAQRFGLKWGRRLPIMATRFIAAAGYGLCLILGSWCTPDPSTRWLPWAVIGCLSLSTFSCDLGVPAIWAYSQDVGGRYTASIMGWANMFGNFGAAFAPLLYNMILGETPTTSQWNTLFAFCTAVFLTSGLTALVLDATKPVTELHTHRQ